MGLEAIKKSLVNLDQSLNELEGVIDWREEVYQNTLNQQADIFSQEKESVQTSGIEREEMVQKLDEIIVKVSDVLK